MSEQELERAVSQLNSAELEQFSSWFAEFKNRLWDDQFEQDVQSGKLDKLAEQALESYRRGDYRKL
jgi:mRNA-degrading endonuclease RelE of RelBE toxin-antitoxin system